MPETSLKRAEVIASGQALLTLTRVDQVLVQVINTIDAIIQPDLIQIYLFVQGSGYVLCAEKHLLDEQVNLHDLLSVESLSTDVFSSLVNDAFIQDHDDETRFFLPLKHQDRTVGYVVIYTTANMTVLDAASDLSLLAVFAATAVDRHASANGQIVRQAHQLQLIAMTELASAVSHQLNNPLTAILTNAELLLMQTDASSAAYQSLQAIEKAGRRAAGVVKRLAGLSYVEKVEGVPQELEILDTIQSGLYAIRSNIERDHIKIVESYDELVPPIWVYPDVLDDLWLNLLLNAHEAVMGQDDAKIGIEVHYLESQQMIEVNIWNNGPQIDVDDWDKIFYPFYTTKDVTEHTGLGLHICKQISDYISGHIVVKQHQSGGMCFTVYIPVKKG